MSATQAFAGGRKVTIGGVHFLQLRGSAIERARQHAGLLKNEIRGGVLPALARHNVNVIRRGHGGKLLKLAREAVVAGYRYGLLPRLSAAIPREWRQLATVFAKEAGISRADFYHCICQPDALLILAKLGTAGGPLRLAAGSAGGAPGCSSAIVNSKLTNHGGMFHARNLDYPIPGPWESAQICSFHEPREAGEIPVFSVSSAGVHTTGITAMNAAGLTLATHAHFGARISLRGTPIVILGDRVIRHAKRLAEAVDLVRAAPRIANWSFVMSSASENRAIVMEMTPDRHHVREMEGPALIHTNYFHGSLLQKTEVSLCHSYAADLRGRFCNMEQTLQKITDSGARVDAPALARMLGSHEDGLDGETRIVGNTVSVVSTVQSVIFAPGEQIAWIGARGESPAALGGFLQINCNDFWADPEGHVHTISNTYYPESFLRGVHLYREAYRELQILDPAPGCVERAFARLREACELAPDDGHLLLITGLTGFYNKSFDACGIYFKRVLSARVAPHIRDVARLFLARRLDLRNDRAAAIAMYQDIQQTADPKLRAAVARGLRRPWRERELVRMRLDLQFADALLY